MTLTKPFLTITSLVVAALFGGGVYIVMNMDMLAKGAIERLGSEALGVDVSLGGVKISLQEKKATVSGLKVANPEGFKKSHALSVDEISVALGDISKALLVLNDITVKGTSVNLEVQENGTNLLAIRDGMPAKPAQEEPVEAPTAEGEAAQETLPPVKVIVKRFELGAAQLNPSVTLLSEQDLAPVIVPDIVLTGIGEKENGVLAREAVKQIWTQVSARFSATANEAGFYQGLSEDVIKDVVDGQLGGFKDKLQDGINKVSESLKGLF